MAAMGQFPHWASQCVRHSEAFLALVTSSMPRTRVTLACHALTLISPSLGSRKAPPDQRLLLGGPTPGDALERIGEGVALAAAVAHGGLPLA